jgi:hypothetical protein|tara:strand:+ start:735 stop:1475 length:741 start_codon:yes stop_codon:yes gene_type:complete
VGGDGLVTFAPAGTSVCIGALALAAGSNITVGTKARYRVGDPITVTNPASGTPDGNLPNGNYFVVAVGTGTIQVSSTLNGSAITLDGAAYAANDWGSGHMDIKFTGTEVVCSVQEWSLDLTAEMADVTTLPCGVSTGGTVAPVRKQQKTTLNGEGSMTLLFTEDQQSMGDRLLADSIMMDSTVYAKLYISAVAGAGSTVDDANSRFYAGKVNLMGFSITANTSDALSAEVTFSVADTPDAIFGVTV